MKFLDYDGPLMGFLGRVADLILLNVISLIFSLPIFTIGTALTATHYTALKIRRGEGHVWSNFWKSFKENFKQSTIIWLILMLHFLLAVAALTILPSMKGMISSVMQVVVMAAVIFGLFLYAWIFPIQSKFINDLKNTFKNTCYFVVKHFFRTFLMAILNVLPFGLLALLFFTMYVQGMGIWLLFGISLPIYWCAMTYDKVFEKIEDEILGKEEDTEEITM